MPGRCIDSHNNANEEGQIYSMALLVQHLKTIGLISKFTAPSKFTLPASGAVASSQPLFVRVSYILYKRGNTRAETHEEPKRKRLFLIEVKPKAFLHACVGFLWLHCGSSGRLCTVRFRLGLVKKYKRELQTHVRLCHSANRCDVCIPSTNVWGFHFLYCFIYVHVCLSVWTWVGTSE